VSDTHLPVLAAPAFELFTAAEKTERTQQ